MTDPVANQGPEYIPVDPPDRYIHVDVQRTLEDVKTSVEWLVLFRRARGDVYDGYYDHIGLEAWIVQMIPIHRGSIGFCLRPSSLVD